MKFITRNKKNLIYLAIIAFITILIYSNALESEFQLDDNHVVIGNEKIQDLGNFFSLRPWKKFLFNREFAYFTVAVNYAIHGNDVFGYHLFNLIIHLISAGLVYWFILLLFRSQILKNSKTAEYSKQIAFFTALIFAVHPVQIQAVTYITQRMASLASLFYFLSMVLYLKARYVQIESGSQKPAIKFYVLTFVSFVIGNYSKAIIMTLPLALLILEFLFIRKKDGKRSIKVISVFSAVIFFAAIGMFLTRGLPQQNGSVAMPDYFYTEINVLVTYLRLMLLPVNLQLYYHYPISTTLFTPLTLLKFLFLIGLFISAFYLSKKHVLISFAILWFFTTQIIESSIFALQYVIFEYRIYPAIISFGLVLSYIGFGFLPVNKKYVSAALIVVSLIFASATYDRNFVWKDGVTLWGDNVEKAPTHPVPFNHLGTYYFLKGDTLNAMRNYKRSIQLDTNYAEPYNHLGVLYKENGNYNTALYYFRKSLQKNSENALTINNLGYAYQGLGRNDSAIVYFKHAVQMSEDYHTAMNNLAITYLANGEPIKALEQVDNALEIRPNQPNYNNNKGNILFAMNKISEAQKYFARAIEIDPYYYKAVNNLGMVYLKQNQTEEALKLFNKALQINPRYADPYLNRALVMFQLKNYNEAYKQVLECLKINPAHPKALGFKNMLENLAQNQKSK